MAKLDREELHDLYWNKQLNQGEIADRLGKSESTVSRWMRLYNIPTRTDKQLRIEPQTRKSAEVQDVERRYGAPIDDVLFQLYWIDGRLSQSAVAEELGLDSSTISRWMTMYDVPTRESMRLDDIFAIANRAQQHGIGS